MAFVKALLKWFKTDFFKWTNAPPCAAHCGSTKAAECAGMAPPTPEEQASQAGRVELYCCPECGGTTRYPRYA